MADPASQAPYQLRLNGQPVSLDYGHFTPQLNTELLDLDQVSYEVWNGIGGVGTVQVGGCLGLPGGELHGHGWLTCLADVASYCLADVAAWLADVASYCRASPPTTMAWCSFRPPRRA